MGLFTQDKNGRWDFFNKLKEKGSNLFGYYSSKMQQFQNSSLRKYISKKSLEAQAKVADIAEGVSSVSGTAAYITKSALHRSPWNTIVDGFILGGLPIQTKIAYFGEHAKKIKLECMEKERPLAKVYAIANDFELKGTGLLGLTTVDASVWKEKDAKYEQIQMNVNSGKISNKELKASVDDIKRVVDEIKDFISKKKSVLVHCNTGEGRSVLYAACYLMKHHSATIKSTHEALYFIHQKHPQAAISAAELVLVEEFRKNHTTLKTELNIQSKKFEPFRRDWIRTLKLDNPLVQFALAQGAAYLLGLEPVTQRGLFSKSLSTLESLLEGWYTTLVTGTGVLLNVGRKKAQAKIADHAYANLDKQYPTLSEEEKAAVNKGIESEQSWSSWVGSFGKSDTYWHYASYLAGRRAQQEKAPICETVIKEAKAIEARAQVAKPK